MAGAILLQRFQKMRYIFRGRRSTLDVSDSIFRGRRSTSDVSCCVFFANRIGTAARSGNHVQIPWQAWHFLTRVKIGGSLARNARFDACMCVVLRFWLCSGCAVTMGEAAMPYV